MTLGFPRARRITRGAELQDVMREGKRIRTSHLEVRMCASPPAQVHPSPQLRVGIIVPKFSQSAVKRNLVKRRMRELVRLTVLQSGASGAMVIRIRPSAYAAGYAGLAHDVAELVARLDSANRAPA